MEILKYNPCEKGLRFRQNFNTFKEAWEQCPRGDWMLWIAKKLEVDIKILTLAKGYCAKTVYHLMNDKRSQDAVIGAINFGKGHISQAQLKELATAATAYADTAGTATAYAAATAATDTAIGTAYATAIAASYTAIAASYTATEKKNQKKTADICRKYLTKAVFEKLNII
jgi:hypothetical protein